MSATVGIVGMGWVGSSVAISSLHRGVASRLLVNDVRDEVAEGEAMDLAHGKVFYPAATVEAAPVERMVGADAVVISAGRGGAADESRLALTRDNARIARDLGERLRDCQGVIVVVTNPVDVLTRVVAEASGLPPARVIGTGTLLDTARLRRELSEEIGVHAQSVHANVVGEHGDSEVVLWSSATVAGRPLRRWPGWSREKEAGIGDRVRRAAYEIIRRKGATNHAIGLVTATLLAAILRDEQRVLTVSRVQEGALGIEDLALSLPAVVGAAGAHTVLEPGLDDDEQEALERSAEVIRAAGAGLDGE